jgi:hypothetical protein
MADSVGDRGGEGIAEGPHRPQGGHLRAETGVETQDFGEILR